MYSSNSEIPDSLKKGLATSAGIPYDKEKEKIKLLGQKKKFSEILTSFRKQFNAMKEKGMSDDKIIPSIFSRIKKQN